MADAPYEQSRAALRRIYGARKIDASAPYSKQDSTPSARFARAYDATGSLDKASEREAAQFNDQFQPRPFNLIQPSGRPAGWNTASVNPQPNQLGNPLPGFPPYGVVTPQAEQPPAMTPLSFNLSTPSPLDAASLAAYSPTGSPKSYVPPWRKSAAPASYMDSILNGAAKWLS